MGVVFSAIVKLLVLGLVGFVAGKLKLFTKDASKGFSTLIVKITFPAMIFISFQREFTPEILQRVLFFAGGSFLIYAVFMGLVSLLTLKLGRGEERGPFRFALSFANVGFMGFPLLAAIFGDDILFWGSVYNIPFYFLVNSVGVLFQSNPSHKVEKSELFRKMFLNPGVVATLLGVLFFLFSIKLPLLVFDPVKMVGDMTVPLAMVVIGNLLSSIELKGLFKDWRIFPIVFLRLIGLPFLLFLPLYFFVDDPVFLSVAVLLTAMPVALNGPLLAHEYGGDETLTTKLVVVTTLFSIATIPFFVWFLEAVGRG